MSRPGTIAARADLATLLLVATGSGLLVLRLWLPALGATGRMVGLTAILLAILIGSLLVPETRGDAAMPPALVLAVGLATIGLALAAGGRPVATPYAAWALPLALLAAVAEEALFRRAAYGTLARFGAFTAVGVTALAFALVHLPLYGAAAFPVDLGAGLLLSWQRWASGSWIVPAATHAAANLAMTVMR